MEKICQCGCGQAFTSRGRYKHRHRPAETFTRALICACGCGEALRQVGKDRYTPARFIPGHNQRVVRSGRAKYIPTADEIPSGTCECGCGEATPIHAGQNFIERRWFTGHPRPFCLRHKMKLAPSRRGKPMRHPIRARRMPDLTDLERGYFAGIIDGEGTIQVDKQKLGVKKQAVITVSVGSIDKCLIDWLGKYAGTMREFSHRTSAGNRIYNWRVAARADVHSLLTQIEPIMTIKRERALNAIAILEEVMKNDYFKEVARVTS